MLYLYIFFRPCDDKNNCSNDETILSTGNHTELIPIDKLKDEEYHYQFESTLSMNLTQSGIYTCKVCIFNNTNYWKIFGSSEGFSLCNQNSIRVDLNEYSEQGFDIETIENIDNIIEGDQLDLTCSASKYEYHDVKWFKRANPEDGWTKGNNSLYIYILMEFCLQCSK